MSTPLCPYFNHCGGCTAQHIDYQLQLENKKKQLQTIIKYQNIQIVYDKEYFYRNRMDFIFNKESLGLRKKSQWDSIVPIQKCVIAEEKINEILNEINLFFKDCDTFDVKKHSGTFRFSVIRCTPKTSSISFVLNDKSTKLAEAIEKIKEYSQFTKVENILITYVPPNSDVSISDDYFVIKGSDELQSYYINKTFFYSTQGFFQNNHSMAEKMHIYVNNLLKEYETKDSNLLDLYGGVGTFGIINSELFKEITIIESFEGSIKSAQKNISINEIINTKAIVLDAKNLNKLTLKTPLYIITDPPRTGMDIKTIHAIRALKPKVIIYISCNPIQLGKDLQKFPDYEIKSAALFDLFPQTPHSEAIVELVPKTI